MIVTMQCSECGHDVTAGKERCMYCGAALEGVTKADEGKATDVGSEQVASTSISDVPWQFALEKPKCRKPLSLATQIIIFFAAFALVGFIVFLLS